MLLKALGYRLLWVFCLVSFPTIHGQINEDAEALEPEDLCTGMLSVCASENPICVCGPTEKTKHRNSSLSIKLDCANRSLLTAKVCPVSNATNEKVLTEVYLQYNKITELKNLEVVTAYNDQIEFLDLGHNDIGVVHRKAFEGFISLKNLNLESNRIQSLHMGSFEGLENLEMLDLSNNGLTDLRGDFFQPLSKLKVLYLTGNPIKFMDNHTFASLSKLEQLFIDDTKLETVHEEWLIGLNKLKTMSLQKNSFEELPSLHGLSSIETLYLNDNPVKSIAKNTFLGLKKLKQLYMSNLVHLETVDGCAFCGLLNLEVLYLTNCSNLTQIDPAAFEKKQFSRKLNVIDLRNNSLTQISDTLLQWENISQIFLERNPWICDCDMKWINNKQLQIHVPVICAAPASLTGQDARLLQDSDFNCPLLPKKLRGRIMVFVILTLAVFSMFLVMWYLFFGSCCKKAKKVNFSARKRMEQLYAYRNLAMKSEKDENTNNDPEDALWSKEWATAETLNDGFPSSSSKAGTRQKQIN